MKLTLAVRPRITAASCRACTAKASLVQSRCFSDGISGSSSPDALESEPNRRKREPWLMNKRAIITGGSRGIGEAIASRLAYSGAHCTLVGRDEWALQSTIQNLTNSGVHSYVVGDVRDEDMWSDMLEKTVCSPFIPASSKGSTGSQRATA